MFDANENHSHKSVTLLALGLLVFTLFQFYLTVSDRVTLSKARLQLDQNHEQADKALAAGSAMIDKLNDVAIATQKLANAGNANAREIVGQLNKAGIKIDPNYKKGQPPAATAPGATPPAGEAPATPPAQP